jgi:exopolysaccharide biosynthesis protein
MRTPVSVAVLCFIALAAPVSRTPAPLIDASVDWRAAAPGLDRATIDVAGGGEGWRTRVVAVRVDPRRYRFRLRARLHGVEPAWSVDRAPADAAVAVNVGQFNGITPWGWVVMDGREIRPPGQGPLSTAVAWDRAGEMLWLEPEEIDRERATGRILEAFQSYPTLIDARRQVPRQIREPGLGVDVEHRDARLAIGALDDGRTVLAMTRFYGFGALSPSLPLGLNLSEMAAVMQRLGCHRSVSLDGGVSAQLMVREQGRARIWRGWRRVPMGLIAEAKVIEGEVAAPVR